MKSQEVITLYFHLGFKSSHTKATKLGLDLAWTVHCLFKHTQKDLSLDAQCYCNKLSMQHVPVTPAREEVGGDRRIPGTCQLQGLFEINELSFQRKLREQTAEEDP